MKKRQVVVVGAGPAGLLAAIEATRYGAEVLLVDENARPGGQLFKQIHKFFGSREHWAGVRGIDIGQQLLDEARALGVETWLDSVVYGIFENNTVGIRRGSNLQAQVHEMVQADAIVIATGAAEKSISFQGWTLPGVMGAGAIQTMMHVHKVLPGSRFLMIGSGNVGLIVSYQLLQAGAESVYLVEAAPQIGGYAVHAAKIVRAGVTIRTSHTVLEARGNNEVEEALICEIDERWRPVSGTERALQVDTIAVATGLKPMVKLARMAGCRCAYLAPLGGWLPLHNGDMETTVAGIFIAGDISGVEEANTAIDEGRLAGVAVAERLKRLSVDRAAALKKDIRERLTGLRFGPFGVHRLQAKTKVLELYENCRG